MESAGRVVGVVGARGGAGASTLAAALARRWSVDAAPGRGDAQELSPVVLVDLDAAGGGLDVHLGIEAEPGARWADLHGARGEVSGTDVAAVLPAWCGVPVLSTDRWRAAAPPADVVTDVLAALVRSHRTVVLDLSRPDVLGTGAGVRGCTTVLVVVPRDLRSVAGVVALRDVLHAVVRDVRLVVRGGGPGRLGVLEVAHVVDLPVAATMPWDRRLPGLVERGMGPVPRTRGALGRTVSRLVAELA